MNKNSALALIEFWHKIESFTPYELNKGTYVIDVNTKLYWDGKQSAQNKNILFYMVYLGVFYTSEANVFLDKTLGTEKLRSPNDDEIEFGGPKTCYCTLKLDPKGKYIKGSVKFSTMPWALGKVAKSELISSNWSSEFREFTIGIEQYVEENLEEKVNYFSLSNVLRILFEYTSWKPEKHQDQLIQMSIFESTVEANRLETSYQIEKKISSDVVKLTSEENQGTNDKQLEDGIKSDSDDNPSKISSANEEDDDEILNSFYLKDIEKVISSINIGNIGRALSDYITAATGSIDQEKIDLNENIQEISKAIDPILFSSGRWPANTDRSLSLMQQVGVNLIYRDLFDQAGIFSINGPPGTGKTTLLSDVFANIITRRAKRLVEIINAENIFKHHYEDIGKTKNIKGKPFKHHLYEMLEDLSEYSIIVASSNNGAVQNVTQELPDIKSIEMFADRPFADYFRVVAKNVFKKDAWGMISVSLGNSANRRKFVNDFWGNQSRDADEDTTQVYMSDILSEGTDFSCLDWQEAKTAFNAAERKLNDILTERINWKNALFDKNVILRSILENHLEILNTKKSIRHLNDEETALVIQKDRKLSEIGHLNEQINTLEIGRRWWFSVLFWLKFVKSYEIEILNYRRKKIDLLNQLKNLEELIGQCITEKESLNARLNSQNVKQRDLKATFKVASTKLKKAKERLRDNFPDKQFWKLPIRDREKFQLSSPWSDKELNAARTELFLAALEVHKSFVWQSRKQIRNNLKALFDLMNGKVSYTKAQPYLQSLWNTFHLVVPVVSTTFASVASMYKGMGRESLGWLFIDEAGQAMPQAAIGAIWRAKKVVVVGDPLQIEPVVTIHDKIIEKLQERYHVNDFVASKTCSVQSIADEANRYGTFLGDEDNKTWIGSPLFVHRRCIEPMFSISNRIAYDGLMVKGTREPDPELKFAFNHTYWLDVKGSVAGKHWVPNQGEEVSNLVIDAFHRYKNIGVPDLYIISPFTEITRNLKSLLKSKYNQVSGIVSKKSFDDWVNKSIGTVHTFQGKQADNVIFCLGLDKTAEGAAVWASNKPNLLNVAASRAKYRFCIVGDVGLWKSKQHFNIAYKLIEGQSVRIN